MKPIKSLSRILLFPFLLSVLIFSTTSSQELYKVDRVIDGDTFVLSNGVTVRLIGVDTPESQDPRKPVEYFSEESSNFLKTLIEGKEVRLEYDQEKKDKYGRLLAYVHIGETFVNTEVIKQGYGHAYLKYPFKYLDDFLKLEIEARKAGRGLWGTPQPKNTQTTTEEKTDVKYIGSKNSNKYHYPSCRWAAKIKSSNLVTFSSPEDAQEAGYIPCKVCNPPVSSSESIKATKPQDDKDEITVYITRTGSKYHRGTCSYLRKSAIPIALKEAKARGYTPCSRCRPPR